MAWREFLLAGLAAASATSAQGAAAARPRIMGVAQVAIGVRSVAAARGFYAHQLGCAEPFSLKNPDGSVRAVLFKVDDRQTVEVVPAGAPPAKVPAGKLVHLSLETNNADAMRRYLKSKGVSVPDQVSEGKVTTAYFAVVDPDSRSVEFMQLLPHSWTAADFGKHLPPGRQLHHLDEVRLSVRMPEATLHFYRDVLGFVAVGKDEWRVPEGRDRLKFEAKGKPDGVEIFCAGPPAGGARSLADPDGIKWRIAP